MPWIDEQGNPTAPGWMKRLYAPAVTTALVLLGGNWVAGRVNVDPLTVAQNSRLTFQSNALLETPGLSSDEQQLARDVLERDVAVRAGYLQLLYLGNSQTLAIMDRNPGDLTSAQWLQVLLAREHQQVQVRLGSLPNMSCTEMLIAAINSIEDSPRRCDTLLAGLVLEELRAIGIRPEVQALARGTRVRDVLQRLVSANPDLPRASDALRELFAPPATEKQATLGGRSVTVVQRVDDAMLSSFRQMPLVAKRDRVLASLFYSFHHVRNNVLGITSATTRPVPEPAYKASLQLLEVLLRYASARHVPVHFYLTPIRPIQPNPNLPADVARFRQDLPQLCAKYGAHCVDYSELVPESLWTNYSAETAGTGGQRDFAHFTGAAHKLVAQHLARDVGPAMGIADLHSTQGEK